MRCWKYRQRRGRQRLQRSGNNRQNKPFATDPDTGAARRTRLLQVHPGRRPVDNQEALSLREPGATAKIAYRTALDGQGEAARSLHDIPEKSYCVARCRRWAAATSSTSTRAPTG